MIHLYLTLYFIVEALFNSYVIRWGAEIAKLKGKKITHYNRLWHNAQAGQVILLSLLVFIVYYTKTDSFTFLIWVFSIRFAVFDIALNTFLGVKPFNVGTTGFIDRMFQKTSHPELLMVVAKITVLIISFILSLYI